jgi:hypothetical protein
MTVRENKLRKLLDSGKPSIGTRVHSIWPGVAEAIGHTGMFDYVEFLVLLPYFLRWLGFWTYGQKPRHGLMPVMAMPGLKSLGASPA